MKQFLLFAFFSVFSLGLSAQVYVDADATGSGDGTSWANAYPNLNNALLAAPAGASVWIADGTYTTPDSVSFFINKELTVLGGFNGTETSAEAADPVANETILSGDVLGNDAAGVYDSLTFADNNRILSIVDPNAVPTFTVTLDGLTFTNGGIALDQPQNALRVLFSGGAIRAVARTNASRLKFSGNRANYGSAVAIVSSMADSSVFDDITLEGNFSGGDYQFFIDDTDEVTVMNSNFIAAAGEVQESGFLYALFSLGLTVDNCNFSNLTTASRPALAGQGSGLRAVNTDRLLVRNSTFTGLSADLGGAVLIAQNPNSAPSPGETMGLDDFVFDNCTFTDNTAIRGAAIGSFTSNINLTNSTITGSRSSNIGGAIYLQATDTRSYLHNYSNNTLTDNQCVGAGGAMCLLLAVTADVTGTIDGCTFSENIANDGQGAVAFMQGRSNFTITNSEISENVGGFGTILTRGVVGLDVTNVTFEDNGNGTDAFQGAGIAIYFNPGSAGMTIDSSTFTNNVVVQNEQNIRSGGPAVFLLSFTEEEIPVSITNSTFSANASSGTTGAGQVVATAGALLSSGPMDLSIDQCDFFDNSTEGDGGAINVILGEVSRDTTNNIVTVVNQTFSGSISNSRFVNSSAMNQGGAISTQKAVFDVANCVFVNNSANNAGGGAISFNGNAPFQEDSGALREVGSVVLDANLVHNTFALNSSNEGAFGNDIALFQPGDTNDPDTNSLKVVLLNNAFLNTNGRPAIQAEPGANQPAGFIEVGDLFVESLGGNFYNSEYDSLLVLNAADSIDVSIGQFAEISALFADLEDNTGEGPNTDLVITDPLTDNPLINNGVANALVPAVDFRGNPRGVAPDVGAYEADQEAVSTGEPLENSGLDITFFPNPTQGFLNVRNDEPSIGRFTLIVADQNGRILNAGRLSGTNNRVDFTNVPAGVYNLQVVANGKIYSKQIVKQ